MIRCFLPLASPLPLDWTTGQATPRTMRYRSSLYSGYLLLTSTLLLLSNWRYSWSALVLWQNVPLYCSSHVMRWITGVGLGWGLASRLGRAGPSVLQPKITNIIITQICIFLFVRHEVFAVAACNLSRQFSNRNKLKKANPNNNENQSVYPYRADLLLLLPSPRMSLQTSLT